MDKILPIGLVFSAGLVIGYVIEKKNRAKLLGKLGLKDQRGFDEEEAKKMIAAVTPYFAFKGIDRFYDIGGFLKYPEVFHVAIQAFVEHYKDMEIDSICGVDARGFVLGPPIALALNKPFFMIRKEGKLPNSIVGREYGKEYEGRDKLCISKGAISKGDKIVLLDDLVATGGTVIASLELIEKLGGVCVEMACVIELKKLGARARIASEGWNNLDIFSLVEEDMLHLDGLQM
mmetsp:Transcript_1040/g.1673  ORF Transcript_1040/g.1673 Transcript_1040/m.1673 type:complete len:232 (-) Transcript_1040:975-1670(-)